MTNNNGEGEKGNSSPCHLAMLLSGSSNLTQECVKAFNENHELGCPPLRLYSDWVQSSVHHGLCKSSTPVLFSQGKLLKVLVPGWGQCSMPAALTAEGTYYRPDPERSVQQLLRDPSPLICSSVAIICFLVSPYG